MTLTFKVFVTFKRVVCGLQTTRLNASFLSLLSDCISVSLPGGRQTKKESFLEPESKLSLPKRILSLSLLSDSNQRPRDYKSRALAN